MPTLTGTTTGGFPVAAAAFTVAFSLVHLLSGREEVPDPTRRRTLLSGAGGASVAYIFVLLLPEVSEAALLVGELRGDALLTEQLVYLGALSGFVAFYGVEVFVAHRSGESAAEAPLVFWSHVGVFGLYSALIGFLLFHQERPGLLNLSFYALAMALHFLVTDYGLRQHHGRAFHDRGRWVLAVATLLGGAVGFWTDIGGIPLAMLFAFVAGALVLNVIKEELPALDESRFAAFLVGVVASSVLLLLA